MRRTHAVQRDLETACSDIHPESRDIQLVVFSFSAVQHPYVYPARLSVGTPGERPPDAPRLPDEFLSSGRYRRICGYKRSSVPPHRPDRAFLDLALPSDPHRDQRRRSLLSKAPKRYKEYSLLPHAVPGSAAAPFLSRRHFIPCLLRAGGIV